MAREARDYVLSAAGVCAAVAALVLYWIYIPNFGADYYRHLAAVEAELPFVVRFAVDRQAALIVAVSSVGLLIGAHVVRWGLRSKRWGRVLLAIATMQSISATGVGAVGLGTANRLCAVHPSKDLHRCACPRDYFPSPIECHCDDRDSVREVIDGAWRIEGERRWIGRVALGEEISFEDGARIVDLLARSFPDAAPPLAYVGPAEAVRDRSPPASATEMGFFVDVGGCVIRDEQVAFVRSSSVGGDVVALWDLRQLDLAESFAHALENIYPGKPLTDVEATAAALLFEHQYGVSSAQIRANARNLSARLEPHFQEYARTCLRDGFRSREEGVGSVGSPSATTFRVGLVMVTRPSVASSRVSTAA